MVRNREDYNPTPVYNRKMIRFILKSQIEKRDGISGGNVNGKMHDYFEKYKMLKK